MGVFSAFCRDYQKGDLFMCMIYKGVPYPHAFEFINVPIRDELQTFRIVISDYREITEDFTGLCFENSLSVTSNFRLEGDAFYDIINKVVSFTEEGENTYLKQFGKLPPRQSVIDEDVISLFETKKQSKKSLEQYKELRKNFEMLEFFEEPDYIKNIAVEEQLQTLDSIFVLRLSAKIKLDIPKLVDFKYFRTY